MKVLRSLDDLNSELSNLVEDKSQAVIGIDGNGGVGKTLLANALWELHGWKHIKLDELLVEDSGPYASRIDCQAIAAAMGEASTPVIVDGVCLLAVAGVCRFAIDAHVYVKRVLADGTWDAEDQSFCFPDRPIEELIEDYCAERRGWDPTPPDTLLYTNCLRYHQEHSPLDKADCIFELMARCHPS